MNSIKSNINNKKLSLESIKEKNKLNKEIEKAKKGRKRLFTLVSLSEDDDMDLEEIKEQIRDLQNKEKTLQAKYNELSEEINSSSQKEHSQTALEKAVDIYLNKDSDDFSLEDKQKILRTLVKEITIIDSDTINIHIF